MTKRTATFYLAAALVSICVATSATAAIKEGNGALVSRTVGYAVIADTPEITTTLEATTDRPWDFGGKVEYWNCPFGPESHVELGADSSVLVPNFGGRICGPRLGAVKVTATNANVATFVTFNVSGHRTTGYEIPLLTQPVSADPGATEIRLVANPADHLFSTSLLLFNVAASRTWVTATIYDDAHPFFPIREYILTNPRGELTWYDIQTRFESGRIELTMGLLGFGCLGCETAGEVYGFAAIGTPNGDAPRVRPVQPKNGLGFALP
jgi:hypothetical protein